MSVNGTLKIPTTSPNKDQESQQSEDSPEKKKRKRPSNSAYVDINDSVSVSAGLITTSNININQNLTATTIIPQQTTIPLPQNMVPVWAIPSNAVVSGGNAFFMVPTNQPQFFTLARPITGFVSSMVTPVIQLQQQASTSSNTCTTSPVMKSPARATVMAPSTAATTTTQMLRDFSLEIYDRQELQLLRERN
ncbi:hypothetical protein TSUD_349110 [Trifolium subterraneum]|uniref:TCP domain-containing protein n=1 Tax=Trifolium subterraneum TaxID=3900 RepID=A0A2Z6NBY4_TRISU|nr:hypothetical protein TSUD_349110 [Trifolium subterraneum]